MHQHHNTAVLIYWTRSASWDLLEMWYSCMWIWNNEEQMWFLILFCSFHWLQNFVRNRESSNQTLSSGRGHNGKSRFSSYLKPGLLFWVFHITQACSLSVGCFLDLCISFCKTDISICCRTECSHLWSSDEIRGMKVNNFCTSLSKFFGALNVIALKVEAIIIRSCPFINLKTERTC